MRIYFDYPLATEENIKAVKEAIDTGVDVETLFEMFEGELLWDCYIVMSGQQDTPWQVFDWQNGNEQYEIEEWQRDRIENYIGDLKAKKPCRKLQ